jgi:hypothetical protein
MRYIRFPMSLRNVEDLLGKWGVETEQLFKTYSLRKKAWAALADHAIVNSRERADLGDLAARGVVKVGIVDVPLLGSPVVGITVTFV